MAYEAYGIAGTAMKAMTIFVYDQASGVLLKKLTLSTPGDFTLDLNMGAADVFVVGVSEDGSENALVYKGITTISNLNYDNDIWWNVNNAGPAAGRILYASGIVNDKLYILGGKHITNSVYYDDIYEYDLINDTWVTKTETLPANRYGAASCTYNGCIYVAGGRPSGSTRANTLYRYNPSTGVIDTLASLPVTIYGMSGVVVNGKWYCHGGYSGTYSNALRVYDFSQNTWSTLTAGASAKRYGQLVHYDGYLYRFGGDSGSAGSETLYRYDMAGDTWADLGNSGNGRTNHTMTIYGDKIYVMGGQITNGGAGQTTTYEYDISEDTWTQVSNTIRGQVGGGTGDNLYNGNFYWPFSASFTGIDAYKII